MTKNPRYSAYRPSWMPPWKDFGCVVTAKNGTQGFAVANHGKPVATIIAEYSSQKLHAITLESKEESTK